MNAMGRFQTLASLTGRAFAVWGALSLAACASVSPERYQSFFQATETARVTGGEAGRDGLDAACSGGSLAACDARGGHERPEAPIPILQGATTDAATEVLLLLPPGSDTVQVFLWDPARGRLVEPRNVVTTPLPQNLGKMLAITYEDLERVPYRLQVVDAEGRLLDARDLTTLDVSKRQATIAVASSMDDRHPLARSIWADLASQEPDVLFLVGDTVYVDSPAPDEAGPVVVTSERIWMRYAQARRALPLFRLPRLIPTFAVWDDHDYGQNDGDLRFEHKAEAARAFKTFFGAADFPGVYDHGPGISSRLNAFGQRFFFLDNRSFRTPAGARDATHFGVDQESWLFTDIYGEQPSWLISGDQFFGGYHPFESYEGSHAKSFERFLARLRENSPILFLSGDRHLAELMAIPADVLGFETFEITSSPIHAPVYPDPWKDTPNPRQIEGIAGVNNFAILEIEATEGLVVGVRVYGPDSRRLLARRLEVHR